jgi:short-subunit dehydrogenase
MRTHCEGLRIELRGTGVHVTTICPGFVRTPMTDKNQFNMAFLLEAEPAAKRMLRAIARKRRVYNFPRRLWWLVRFGMMTPRWLFDAAVGSQTGKMGGRTQALSDGSKPPLP